MQAAAQAMPHHKDIVEFTQVGVAVQLTMGWWSCVSPWPQPLNCPSHPPPSHPPPTYIRVPSQRKRRLAEDSFAKATTALLTGNPNEANHHVTVSLCMLPTEVRYLVFRAGTHRALVSAATVGENPASMGMAVPPRGIMVVLCALPPP